MYSPLPRQHHIYEQRSNVRPREGAIYIESGINKFFTGMFDNFVYSPQYKSSQSKFPHEGCAVALTTQAVASTTQSKSAQNEECKAIEKQKQHWLLPRPQPPSLLLAVRTLTNLKGGGLGSGLRQHTSFLRAKLNFLHSSMATCTTWEIPSIIYSDYMQLCCAHLFQGVWYFVIHRQGHMHVTTRAGVAQVSPTLQQVWYLLVNTISLSITTSYLCTHCYGSQIYAQLVELLCKGCNDVIAWIQSPVSLET